LRDRLLRRGVSAGVVAAGVAGVGVPAALAASAARSAHLFAAGAAGGAGPRNGVYPGTGGVGYTMLDKQKGGGGGGVLAAGGGAGVAGGWAVRARAPAGSYGGPAPVTSAGGPGKAAAGMAETAAVVKGNARIALELYGKLRALAALLRQVNDPGKKRGYVLRT